MIFYEFSFLAAVYFVSGSSTGNTRLCWNGHTHVHSTLTNTTAVVYYMNNNFVEGNSAFY